jgi:hypothetical protein
MSMKNRKVKIKVKHDTVEFDMGDLRAGGHTMHYDAELLRKDEKLLTELMHNNMGSVISRGKPKKKEDIVED